MERGMGSGSNGPSVPVDKTRVLDITPLRTLVPVFPSPAGMSSVSAPQPSPFTCVPPTGPFPTGVQPFYPFMAPNGTQQQTTRGNFGSPSSIPAPVPLNSYRTPTAKENGGSSRSKRGPYKKTRAKKSVTLDDDDDDVDDGDYSGSLNQSEFSGHVADAEIGSGSSRKRRGRPSTKGDENGMEIQYDIEPLLNSILTSFKLNELDEFRRSSGDKETSAKIVLVYDVLRRKLTQLEEANKASTGVARRPDLRAATLLMKKGIRTNTSKRIGHVPGVEVGDIFFFRMELCVLGLHAPSMAGIDYMSVKVTMDEEPVAVSIVSSGGYDDDDGADGDVLIYSGQGGVQRRDGQMFDQELKRGNLALEKSLHRANEVRVIRGLKDPFATGKVYIYDGLYKIQESWAEKNQSECNVFKYKLVRIPGQPQAFSLWKSIQQWKDGTASREGLILPDLTSGSESLPVSLVNDVDNEKGPAHFTYVSTLKSKPFPLSNPSLGCQCKGGCKPDDKSCPCNQRNDGLLPYSAIGVLLSNVSLIHECGFTCVCPPTCRGRISQAGLRLRLEVFKTKDKGWGLRSLDPIRGGAFICEYAGDIIKGDVVKEIDDDDYIFDSTRLYESLEAIPNDSNKLPYPIVISAKNNGNVGRFMNHSCSPNVLWKPVLRESNNETHLHIAFFAIRHIPPMQELTFNYGIVTSEKGDQGKKKCLCGSVKCNGFFY